MQVIPKASVVSMSSKVGFPVAKSVVKKTKAAKVKEVKLAVKQDGFAKVEEIPKSPYQLALEEVQREAAEYHAAQQADFFNKGVGRLFGDPDWFHEMKQVTPLVKPKPKKKSHTETVPEKRRPGYSMNAEKALDAGVEIPSIYNSLMVQYVEKAVPVNINGEEVIHYRVTKNTLKEFRSGDYRWKSKDGATKDEQELLTYMSDKEGEDGVKLAFLSWADMRVTKWIKEKLEARAKKGAI